VVGCRECHKTHTFDLEQWEIVKHYLDIKESDHVCMFCHNAHTGEPRHTNPFLIEIDLAKIRDPYAFYDSWIYKLGRWLKDKF
jgi:hypothetical protein